MYDFPPQILEALMIDIKLVREACKIDNNLDALIYYIFNLRYLARSHYRFNWKELYFGFI